MRIALKSYPCGPSDRILFVSIPVFWCRSEGNSQADLLHSSRKRLQRLRSLLATASQMQSRAREELVYVYEECLDAIYFYR